MTTGFETPARARPGARIGRMATAAAGMMLGVLLLGMVVLNVVNAVGRYAFGAVFVGADELLVFAMIWLVMVGLVLVTAARRNIALDFLVNRAGPRARTILAIVHHTIMTLACGYAVVQSLAYVRRLTALEQTSMALGMPMAIAHSALIVGFGGAMIVGALLAAEELATLLASRRNRREAAE